MNTIALKNIIPAPLGGLLDNSKIWGQSLTFEQGARYHIFAPSGKGKSTFIHIIYGLRTDFAGSLSVCGKTTDLLSSEDWATLRTRQLAIVFQDLRLFLQFTALENIQLKNQLTNHKSEKEIRAMAGRLGIADLLDRSCEQLSYGQRQRVAIIRAVCQPFDFILLDEPFSHLDTENTKLASQLLEKECLANGAGLLITSLGKLENKASSYQSLVL